MRKAQKKQAEDFLNLLEQARGETAAAIERGNIPEALSLLANCQEGAVSLGNLIEKSEGEGFVTVSFLEEYCERVYQLYARLFAGEKVDAYQSGKTLRRILIKIENSLANDIKVQTEAVFLPYKASMWDSMESIWRAANEDPGCTAYVIPIPYFDKNPDGSFREIHYEGDCYPKDVPVMWYEDYNFAARRPDTIFIHNPYDDCNLVTSVPPFFYSKNLKQFTDKLVYLPYFVMPEIDPENERALEGVAHLIKVPAMIYADQVIVQSEKVRLAYIKVMTKYVGEDTREIWEKKVLGLGSPKFDKVARTKKEDVEIPEDWMKIIQKPDGSWKKIIFYNTSISTLLSVNEKMLKKMRGVFLTFKEYKDDIALLWRPHPLILATIESMRPQLLGDYQKIVAKYQEEGWGIYDDSADLNRAIAISDAYYGDHSSVVQLYQKTGKPIMIQNVEVEN